MGAIRLRRLALVAGVLVLWSPVFSRADTGEREEPASDPASDPSERPEHELRIEAAPSTGYGRFAMCDSLSRVRYGGLGASARYRYKALAMKVGGSVSAAHEHTTDESEEDPAPDQKDTRAVVDGVAQIGFDTRYVALLGGVGVVNRIRGNDDDDDGGAGLVPSGSLWLGSEQGVSFRLALADTEPIALALVAAELDYQHRNAWRAGIGARLDAFTLNAMPTARFALPLGPHWLGLRTGAVPSEGAVAWQLQLLFDLQLLALGPQ